MRQIKRAVEARPVQRHWSQCFYAVDLYIGRRYDEAIAAAREALRIQPDFPFATNTLWLILHEKKGMEKESFEAVKDLCESDVHRSENRRGALTEVMLMEDTPRR